MDLQSEAQALFPYTQSFRRDLHRHPELAFNETRTANLISNELKKLNIQVISGVGITGIVGILKGQKSSPVMLLRFDMDALPIIEENSVDYASGNHGIMHACGHDGHVAVGLTLAKVLSDHQDILNGTVKFVFQPAEETLSGAKAMIKDGVMQNPSPDYLMGMHLWNEKPVGWIALTPGPLMAGADIFSIRITGKGGHAANPHLSNDAVLAASYLNLALQSIVSRNVPPLANVVLSVTKIEGGTSYNIIPPYVDLAGTIRSFDPDVREHVINKMNRLVESISASFGCQSDIKIRRLSKPVINDQKITNSIRKIAEKMFDNISIDNNYRTMISEDVCYYMDDIPACFILIGSSNPDQGLIYEHHHPRFDFDENCLPPAIALLATSTISIIDEQV